MSENDRDRVVVKIPTAMKEAAALIMARQKLKYQSLLLSLFAEWLKAQGANNQVLPSDSSPLETLNREERLMMEGLVIGLRANDAAMAGLAHNIKLRIKEKGYEYQPKTTEKRDEYSRRKVAG